MSTVAQIVEWLSRTYPPRLAESWDAVGLVAGRPAAPVHRILVTVDVTQAVAGQAVAGGYDLIVAHHPLLLGGVTSVAATSAKGRILHDLIEANCALLTAHTNADAAREGVSDALAASLGLAETAPLETSPAIALDHLHVYVPESDAALMLDALAEAGAGAIGNYDRCAFLAPGVGTFRPLPGAAPAIGTVGEVQTVDEVRLEVVLARAARDCAPSPAAARTLARAGPITTSTAAARAAGAVSSRSARPETISTSRDGATRGARAVERRKTSEFSVIQIRLPSVNASSAEERAPVRTPSRRTRRSPISAFIQSRGGCWASTSRARRQTSAPWRECSGETSTWSRSPGWSRSGSLIPGLRAQFSRQRAGLPR